MMSKCRKDHFALQKLEERYCVWKKQESIQDKGEEIGKNWNVQNVKSYQECKMYQLWIY